ncbi:MAG: chemotaxis protein CheA [Coriobacteriia bacterium]|nr:chemotaxis protein CheA [Coriobacteriia bacterium]
MDQYRDVFLAESADYMLQIVDGLLALESAPHDLGPVETVFRGAHSLKGMSAAMGYEKTANLTHRMESLMDRVRKGEVVITSDVVNLMLAAVDLVKEMIDDESAGAGRLDPSEMIQALDGVVSDAVAPADKPSDVRGAQAGAEGAVEAVAGAGTLIVTVRLDESCVLKAVRAYMVIKRLAHMGRVVETRPSAQDIEDEKFGRSFQIVLETVSSEPEVREAATHVNEVVEVVIEPLDVEPSAPAPPAPSGQSTNARRRDLPKLSQTQTVRVAIGHLDTLVDLVGELVILRSRLERLVAGLPDAEIVETVDELQRISTDLQYEVMQTRMVPVGNIFNRFPRMVRDLADELGKKIEFCMDGLDIELDRTVLDEIGDPLVHLLRNCIDHGIESSDSRLAAGKPEIGRISLTASRERDHVAIVVSDDGKGMDVERVWSKAVQRGLVTEAERCDYDDSEILDMTCLPGFTTMDATSRVSGRGVGMDVVKGKVEHLGGTVQILSVHGAGTEFILRLPLTLAIVQALLVEANQHVFAMPLASVDEVLSAEDVRIETVDGSLVVVLRDGEVVPLQRLDAILYDASPATLPEPRSAVVLVQSGAQQRALHVDGIVGRREIVVKPLSGLFRDQRGFSGATILGDGSVILILDLRVLSSTEG